MPPWSTPSARPHLLVCHLSMHHQTAMLSVESLTPPETVPYQEPTGWLLSLNTWVPWNIQVQAIAATQKVSYCGAFKFPIFSLRIPDCIFIYLLGDAGTLLLSWRFEGWGRRIPCKLEAALGCIESSKSSCTAEWDSVSKDLKRKWKLFGMIVLSYLEMSAFQKMKRVRTSAQKQQKYHHVIQRRLKYQSHTLGCLWVPAVKWALSHGYQAQRDWHGYRWA